MKKKNLFFDMQKIQKQKLIGILIFVCLLMAILSVSLSMLQMQPGDLFLPQFSNRSAESSSQGFIEINWLSILIQGLQILLIILLPVYLVINLLSKRGRRKLLRDLLKIILLFLIISWISEVGGQLPLAVVQEEVQLDFMDAAEISEISTALPEFEAHPQSWMLIVIIVGAAAFVATITFFGLKFLSKHKRGDGHAQLQELANKAQAALDDLEEAKIEFDDVIVRCYAEMSQALDKEKGIRREQAMTPHEFEKELLAKGFPAHPVRRLTHLFEQVRYGRQQVGENAKQSAKESLHEIIAFCRGSV